MTELKTLKDCGIDVGTHLVIRQEAIKWVKYYEDDKKGLMRECFMEFFNITEEDLKESK